MMKNSTSRVLVTGAKGFIGSACIDLLGLEDIDVYAVSSQNLKNEKYQNVTWVQLNLLDPQSCEKIIKEINPTHLLHLAWTAKPGKFWTDSENFQWLKGSLSLFESFFKNGGEHIVGVGTCAEYEPNQMECSEFETPTLPSSLYGFCKLACGIGAQASATLFDKQVTWGRLFYPYGPSEPPGRFLPDIIDHLLMQQPIKCGTGNQIRDFIYVKDVANVLIKLLKADMPGFINIGSGDPVSLRDVAKIVTKELGFSELIQFGTRQPLTQDSDRIVANIDRLKTDLKWTPSYSLEKGIKEMIKYRSEFLKK